MYWGLAVALATWYNRKNNCMEVDYAKRKKKTECAYFGGAACNSKRKNSGSRELIEAASFSTKRNSGEN